MVFQDRLRQVVPARFAVVCHAHQAIPPRVRSKVLLGLQDPDPRLRHVGGKSPWRRTTRSTTALVHTNLRLLLRSASHQACRLRTAREELARIATAPVGRRNRQLWESTRNLYNLVAPAPLTPARSTRGCSRPRSAVGCWPKSLARPTGPWPQAARLAWPTPAAHDNPPAPNAPTPRRPHLLERPASARRKGGEAVGRRWPTSRPDLIRGVGACRRQAEPAPTHHPAGRSLHG
jgi:hypothetical protein